MGGLTTSAYPDTPVERDRWNLARRSGRNAVHAGRAYGCLVEEERSESGQVVTVATIFLSNRECPWRCLLCDLWKNTLTEPVAAGAIPRQIEEALGRLMVHQPVPRQIKLYNSGSFFDRAAIPKED